MTTWTQRGTGSTEWSSASTTSTDTVYEYVFPTNSGDDTAYLQSLFDSHACAILRSGTYMVNAITNLSIPSGRTIIFDPGAALQVIANGSDTYSCVSINNADNVTLINPVVVGDRDAHTGTTGEHGHGIVISGSSSNVTIRKPVVSDCWGDGINIRTSGSGIYIENPVCDNNRRLGISITDGENVTLVSPVCTNTNGTNPQSGIDLEPNYPTNRLENIRILNPYTAGNAESGIILSPRLLGDAANHVDIYISNHLSDGDRVGFQMTTPPDTAVPITGKISYIDGRCINSGLMGIDVCSNEGWPAVEIVRPYVLNCNTSGNASATYALGIKCYGTTDNLTQDGNVSIINPTVIDNRATPLMQRAIRLVNQNGLAFKNAVVDTPMELRGVASANQKSIVSVCAGSALFDPRQQSWVNNDSTSNITVSGSSYHTNTDAPGLSPFTLNQPFPYSGDAVFENMTAYGMTVTPDASSAISPLSATAGQAITTTDLGARISLRRATATRYVVTEMTGTWTLV